MTTTLTATVASKREVANDIYAFEFTVDGNLFVAADAGSHIDVHVPGGFMRQYSLTRAAAPGSNLYEIAVLKEDEGRGGSLALCSEVQVGDTIEISPPRNHFALQDGQAHYTLMGAGIGMTPILAMARTLHESGATFDLHICAKTAQDLAFSDDIINAPWGDRVHYYYSEAPGGTRLNLSEFLPGLVWNSQVYACGPVRFLDDLDQVTQDWPMGRVRTERFIAQEVELSAEDSGSFTVVVNSTGAEYEVGMDDTILSVLEANGTKIAMSCAEGVCGTCLTEVISGDLIHRDSCLYEEEQAEGNIMAVCISRAKPGTKVVLDI